MQSDLINQVAIKYFNRLKGEKEYGRKNNKKK
jgi:hypothetical protein